ncbi:MAG: double zinc ribbon domain-containing protein [Patescibacteria group bacterium]|nr:hypothetical protein [Patescibacteria group bacterium]
MNILDILFPKRCFNCQKWGEYFCSDCAKKLEAPRNQVCSVCNKISITGQTHPLCKSDKTLDGLICLFPYKSFVGKAIKALKYKFAFSLAEDISTLSVKELLKNKKAFQKLFDKAKPEKTILVPIPLYKTRQNWRGFNQTELIGKIIAKKLNWQFCPDLLLRIKKTSPQVSTPKEKREENIKQAFILNEKYQGKLKNKTVILFDDVYTTGSTLKEGARAISFSKSTTIWGLALAK